MAIGTAGRHRMQVGATHGAWSSAALLLLAAGCVQTRFLGLTDGSPALHQYVATPVLWIVVGGSALLGWRRVGLPSTTADGRITALAGGALHVAILVIAGVFVGFGSTLAHAGGWSLVGNALVVGLAVSGVELARGYLWRTGPGSPTWIRFTTLTVVAAVCTTPILPTMLGGDADDLARRIIGFGLPALASSAVATWLVARGGPGLSIRYMLLPAAYLMLAPTLPNLGMLGWLAVGLGAPLAAFEAMTSLLDDRPVRSRAPVRLGIVPGVIALGLTALLTLGVVRPVVVRGISMLPRIHPNDLAVVVAAGGDDVAVGDVILYEQRGVPVLHRVVAVDADGLTFVTQGDNNRSPDTPVAAAEVRGRLLFTLPGPTAIASWLRGD